MIIQTTSQMKLKSIFGALVLLSAVPAFGENAPASFEEKMVRAEQLISSDSSQAIAIFTEMAEKGYAPAQAYLGELYYWGTYHEPDYKKAHDWLEKAAKDKTQIHSMKLLAEMYTEGKGVPMDSAKAFEWYKKVADSEAYQPDDVLYAGQAYLKVLVSKKTFNKRSVI
ncbi:tetratricopeptide repeat protein [Glaesserella sp.]|uniref:tetratricopeptide repeat protein n=2 Tax=Glaesserella sp. TaxID=2094731 RepID=UPI0035A0011B